MKSLHDFAGELRAAKKRQRRGKGRGQVQAKSGEYQSALWRRKNGQHPDGRREWARGRERRTADDYDTSRVSHAAEMCRRAFGEYPVVVALPVSRYGYGRRRDIVELIEYDREPLAMFTEPCSPVASSVRRHTVRVDAMYNGGMLPDHEFESTTWVQLRDGADWVDTRNLSGRYPMVPGRQR